MSGLDMCLQTRTWIPTVSWGASQYDGLCVALAFWENTEITRLPNAFTCTDSTKVSYTQWDRFRVVMWAQREPGRHQSPRLQMLTLSEGIQESWNSLWEMKASNTKEEATMRRWASFRFTGGNREYVRLTSGHQDNLARNELQRNPLILWLVKIWNR